MHSIKSDGLQNLLEATRALISYDVIWGVPVELAVADISAEEREKKLPIRFLTFN